MASTLPNFTTPGELAKHLGMSERTLREKARSVGACRELGKTMIMLDEDVAILMESLKQCPSRSTSAAKSGTTGALSPGGDYADLQARRSKRAPKGSRPTSKAARGKVILMDQPHT
jgi:hypothetical protein